MVVPGSTHRRNTKNPPCQALSTAMWPIMYWTRNHGPNIYKDTKLQMSSFLKNWPLKVLGGRCYLSEAQDPLPKPPPPPLHTVWIHTPVLIHTRMGGGGRWTSEKVRGALVYKRGRKYEHDWLYLQSINYIKNQLRRHLGFGVFIDIWSMLETHPPSPSAHPLISVIRVGTRELTVSWY